jgi:two-component system chemotaxis response regulator CheY
VADALGGLGHPVRTVGGGIAALAAVRAGLPVLIVLDVEMPDLDGVALVRRLRSDPETAGIPIILHTGRDPGEPRIGEVRDQVQGLISKGGPPDVLLSVVRQVLEDGA